MGETVNCLYAYIAVLQKPLLVYTNAACRQRIVAKRHPVIRVMQFFLGKSRIINSRSASHNDYNYCTRPFFDTAGMDNKLYYRNPF